MRRNRKIKAFIDYGGLTEVKPLGRSYGISIDVDIKPKFSISTPKLSYADFDYVWNIKQQGPCEECYYVLQTAIQGNEIYRGRILLQSGDWDLQNKTCSFELETVEDSQCIDANEDDEKNILENTLNAISVKGIVGDLEYQTCQDINNVNANNQSTGCLTDPGAGWTPLENDVTYDGATITDIRTVWVRETRSDAFAQPPGDGWFTIPGFYVRKPPTRKQDTETSAGGGFPATTIVKERWITTIATNDFKNGRTLETVINQFVTTCGLSVVSNFFGINPDGSSPSNIAYTYAAQHLHNLVMFGRSDVTNFEASDTSTIAKLTWAKLKEDFEIIFNIDIWVDGTTVRLEHKSYQNLATGTTIPGWNLYQYSEIPPKEEKFNWTFPHTNFFASFPIGYGCGQSTKDYTVKYFSTDLETEGNSKASESGIFLMAGYNYGGELVATKQENFRFNGALSWVGLHGALFMHDRYQKSGTLNDNTVTFLSQKRIKSQSVRMKMEEEELIAFDFAATFTTDAFEGVIESAEYDDEKGILTIQNTG